MVGKGGLPPLGLSGIQRERGQAAVPDHEVFLLERFLDVSVPLPLYLILLMLHWIKFNVVGVLGFALQAGALFVLTHNTHRISYLTATALAVELAVLNNFVWHQLWTWRD